MDRLEPNKPKFCPESVMLCEPLATELPLFNEENIGLSYDKASVSRALLAPIVTAAVTERPIFAVALQFREESDTQ
jgi:hypothetical protein